MSFVRLPYVVMNASAICCLGMSAALSAGSVHEISTFKSVFSFFKVSFSVLSSVDQLFQSFASLPRPRIERFLSWSSRRSSVLTTRSSVGLTLYLVLVVDLPLWQTNVSQLLLLVWKVAVPGLAVPVGEPLRRWLAWWYVGFVDNDVLCRCLWPSSLGLSCQNPWPSQWGSTSSWSGLEIGLAGPIWVEVIFFPSTNCSCDAGSLWLRVDVSQFCIGFVGAASVLKTELNLSDCIQIQVVQVIGQSVILVILLSNTAWIIFFISLTADSATPFDWG